MQVEILDSKYQGVIIPPIPKVKHPADDAQSLETAYKFAAQHPEVLDYMPCFCACKREKHRSNEDCFVKSKSREGTLRWNNHAAECSICLTVATRAKMLLEEGKSIHSIREQIETEFATKFKYHTDTPQPPEKAQ